MSKVLLKWCSLSFQMNMLLEKINWLTWLAPFAIFICPLHYSDSQAFTHSKYVCSQYLKHSRMLEKEIQLSPLTFSPSRLLDKISLKIIPTCSKLLFESGI